MTLPLEYTRRIMLPKGLDGAPVRTMREAVYLWFNQAPLPKGEYPTGGTRHSALGRDMTPLLKWLEQAGLSDMPYWDITTEMLQNAPSNRAIVTLRRVFQDLCKDGHAGYNPAWNVKTKTRAGRYVPTHAEIDRFFASVDEHIWPYQPRVAVCFHMMLDSGLAPGDIFNLTWPRYNRERNRLEIVTKRTGQPAVIPLPGWYVDPLTHMGEEDGWHGTLWRDNDGVPLFGPAIRRQFKEAVVVAGLGREFNVTALRKRLMRDGLEAGMSVSSVQMLGQLKTFIHIIGAGAEYSQAGSVAAYEEIHRRRKDQVSGAPMLPRWGQGAAKVTLDDDDDMFAGL